MTSSATAAVDGPGHEFAQNAPEKPWASQNYTSNAPVDAASHVAEDISQALTVDRFTGFYKEWSDRIPEGVDYDQPLSYIREAAQILRTIAETKESTDRVERLAALTALVDKRHVPEHIRMLDQHTRELLEDSSLQAQIGEWTYIVPAALDGLLPPNFKKVRTVARIGKSSNFQEGGKVGEFDGENFVSFSEITPSLRGAALDIGDSVSIAHGVHFAVRPGDTFAKWTIGAHSFVGIGAIIGNGIDMNNAVVYHGAIVGHGVTIGEGSVVGLGARVADNVNLWVGVLVLDGSRIKYTPERARDLATAVRMVSEGKTPLIDDTEYLANRKAYDTQCSQADGHRCFVVHVGHEADEVLRLGTIGKKYSDAKQFSEKCVVPENIAFARIDTLMGSLVDQFQDRPQLAKFLMEERTIVHADLVAEIDTLISEQRALGRDIGHMRGRLIRSAQNSSLLLLARPQDNEGFFEHGFIEIADMIDQEIASGKKDDAAMMSLLKKHFYRPRISEDTRIYGRSVVAGNAEVDGSVLVDSKIRCDEVHDGIAKVEDAVMISMVVHGPRSKLIKGGFYRDGTVHNGTTTIDGEFGIAAGSLPWFVNDMNLLNVQALNGGLGANAGTIANQNIQPGTVYHAGKVFPYTHPDDDQTSETAAF